MDFDLQSWDTELELLDLKDVPLFEEDLDLGSDIDLTLQIVPGKSSGKKRKETVAAQQDAKRGQDRTCRACGVPGHNRRNKHCTKYVAKKPRTHTHSEAAVGMSSV